MNNLEKIERDIERAREYIERHFSAYKNEEETPSGLMDENFNTLKKTWLVEYPDVDRVEVQPMFFGKPMGYLVGASYRLVWRRGKMFWRGGMNLRPDIVIYLEVKDNE